MTTHATRISAVEQDMDAAAGISAHNAAQLEYTTGLIEKIAALQAALAAAHVRIVELEARLRQPYHDARYEPGLLSLTGCHRP